MIRPARRTGLLVSVLLLLTACIEALADQPTDVDSIPEPTRLSVVVSNADGYTNITQNRNQLESEDAKAVIAIIEVLAPGAEAQRGVVLGLTGTGKRDNLYLDANQATRLRDEFAGLSRWYQLDDDCEAINQCVHGVARCRPSQHERQAFCPGFFTRPDGIKGVVISTTKGSFYFPSKEPSVFVQAIDSVVSELRKIESGQHVSPN